MTGSKKNRIRLQVLKVESPRSIWAKEVPAQAMSQEAKQFLALTQTMNDYFNSDETYKEHIFYPRNGEICIGRRMQDKRWYRVKVKESPNNMTGQAASCFLLDYAEDEVIPSRWLYRSQEQFLQVPIQAKQYQLAGIRPVTLVTSVEDFVTSKRPCKRWDLSTTTFLRTLFQNTTNPEAEITKIDGHGKIHVKLYVYGADEIRCVNDVLVEDEYGIYTDSAQAESSDDEGSQYTRVRRSQTNLSEKEVLSGAETKPSPPGQPHETRFSPPDQPNKTRRSPPGWPHETRFSPPDQPNKTRRSPPGWPHETSSSPPDQPNKTRRSPPGLPHETSSSCPGQPNETSPIACNQPKLRPIATGSLGDSSVSSPPPVDPQSGVHGRQPSPVGRGFPLGLATTGSPMFPVISGKACKASPVNSLGRGTQFPGIVQKQTLIGRERPAGPCETLTPVGHGRGSLIKLLSALQKSPSTPSASPSGVQDSSSKGCKGRGAYVLEAVRSRKSEPSVLGVLPTVPPVETSQFSDDPETLNKILRDFQKGLKKVSNQAVGTSTITLQSPPSGEMTRLPDTLRNETSLDVKPDSDESSTVKCPSDQKQGQSQPLPPHNIKPISRKSPNSISGPIPLPSFILGSEHTSDNASKLLGRLPKCVTDLHGTVEKLGDKVKEVSFSENEEILKPRSQSTAEVVTPRSILKNSSSDEMSPAHCQRQTKVYDSSSDEEVLLQGVNKSIMDAGNFLLEALRPGAKTLQLVEELYEEGPAASSFDLGVLVDGERVPRHVSSITQLPFADPIRQKMFGGEVKQTWLQAYGWPAIWRGRDLIGIGASFLQKLPRGGKTYTYLLPLMTQLLHRDAYCKVPVGCGPLAIVLCSSWRRAHTVYEQACGLHGNEMDLRLNVIYGGGAEEAQEIQLVNGCELLIATPHSLLRMVKKDILELKRLCHLVLDDGDNLIEELPSQMEEILEQYKNSLCNHPNRSAPKQIVIMASHWTEGMSDYLNQHMTDPLVIIESKVEAAHYARVDKVVHMVYADQRVSKLLGLLESTANKKMVIFTASVGEAINVYKLLQSHSQYSLLAHEDLMSTVIESVHTEWINSHSEHSQPILVLTDRILGEMQISDAEVVVHYDPPRHKSDLGPRLWCMRSHFHLPLTSNKDKKNAVSLMLVTEEWKDYVPLLITDMRRTNSPIPAALQQFYQGLSTGKEEYKYTELCHVMKAYGKCRSEYRCKARHTIFAALDTPGAQPCYQKLPTSGEVKVYVTSVEDASCCWVRLLEHYDRLKKTDLRGSFAELSVQLNIHFAEWGNRLPCEQLEVGDMCAVEDKQHVYNRAVRIEAQPSNSEDEEKVMVRHVDTGIREWVSDDRIYQLPIRFKSLPVQAVEVYVCRIMPTDDDKEWTNRATDLVTEMVERRQLEGKIVLTLGNTLWLDPLVERKMLTELGVVTNSIVLHQMLLDNLMALHNPLHLQMLYAACRDRVDLPNILHAGSIPNMGYDLHGLPLSYTTATLSEVDRLLPTVFLTAVEHPGHFFLQLAESGDRLDRLKMDLWDHISTSPVPADAQYIIGSLVLAIFPFEEFDEENKCWYRCKIMAEDGDRWDLLYLDTGEREWVDKVGVRPLPAKFTRWPFQAMECSLAYVTPAKGEWSDEDGDGLWTLTTTDNNPQPLKAQVVEIREATAHGVNHYVVALFDTCPEFEVDISQELMVKGLAVPTEYLLELEFAPGATEESEGGKEFDDISRLCRELLLSQEKEHQLTMANRIQNIVALNLSEDCGPHAMACLCRLLGYIADSEVAEILSTSVILLVNSNTSNQHIVCVEDGIQNFCRMIYRENVAFHKSATWALASLAKHKSCWQELLTRGTLRLLTEVLQKTDDPQVQLSAAEGLEMLSQALHEQDRSLVLHSGCVEVICDCLRNPESRVDLLMKCLTALRMILLGVKNQEDCRKVATGALCDRLKARSKESFLNDAVLMALGDLAKGSRINKETMLDLGMLDTLKRLTQSYDRTLTERSKNSAKELYESLLYVQSSNEASARGHVLPQKKAVNNPLLKFADMPQLLTPQEPVHNMPLSREELLSVRQSMCPEVLWFQDRRNLILTIKVKNVGNPDCVTLAPENISFRAVVETIEYVLDLRLYEVIDVSHSEWRLLRGKVLIGLRKVTKGNWPRVTKGKGKVCYLTPDFAHFMDESSSDTEEEVDHDEEKPLDIMERCKPRPAGIPAPTVGRNRSLLLDPNIRPYDDDDNDNQSSCSVSDDDIMEMEEDEVDLRNSFFNV